jgi:hypothetical protein
MATFGDLWRPFRTSCRADMEEAERLRKKARKGLFPTRP